MSEDEIAEVKARIKNENTEKADKKLKEPLFLFCLHKKTLQTCSTDCMSLKNWINFCKV